MGKWKVCVRKTGLWCTSLLMPRISAPRRCDRNAVRETHRLSKGTCKPRRLELLTRRLSARSSNCCHTQAMVNAKTPRHSRFAAARIKPAMGQNDKPGRERNNLVRATLERLPIPGTYVLADIVVAVGRSYHDINFCGRKPENDRFAAMPPRIAAVRHQHNAAGVGCGEICVHIKVSLAFSKPETGHRPAFGEFSRIG